MADDVVDLLVVDRLLVPAVGRLTQTEVAETTGVPIDVVRRLWRALGFLDVDETDRVFTQFDVEAVELFQSMLAAGLVDVESSIQTARVLGLSMARIAEAETSPGSTPFLQPSGDSIVDADQFARQAELALPAMARLLEYVWRRHLQAAVRRAILVRSREPTEGMSPVTAVGFADMVGFTLLSQHLGDRELAAVVSRFEELAHDTVVSLGGRVVKMIGDEVMFVVPSPLGAAEIGLSLAEAYAGDELVSDVRVALAVGPALVLDGDYYGPVVNLASRLVGVAQPGTVLVSDEFRTELGADAARFQMKPLRPRVLKDLGRVQAWKLSRPGVLSAAERRRGVRWERLAAVLRELDDLRDRGEEVVLRSVPRRAARPRPAVEGGPSERVEPGGGDALGAQSEGPLEGSKGPSP